MPIHSSSQHRKKTGRAKGDEQTATGDLTAPLYEERDVPAKNEDYSSSGNQKDGVAQSKSKRDAERACASCATGAAY